MGDEKVVKIPIDYKQRKINEYGQGYVPCEVSNRWLQFADESNLCQGGEFIGVDVMTLGSDEQPKKICQLIINREDIIRALNSVVPK
ncbi:hypothetical protein [Clostridium scatologenes]|uniref:Uncharacterized protein n=1 Tax=Clostridium scatologenes TaxID=1548 RepID=A0A0E3GRD9_CLOSL|nr:hypothetical protein [Clostridium scatologenes]AKA70151.1 hypothetical protein CSCA_3026 [Clostridium scatologenes]